MLLGSIAAPAVCRKWPRERVLSAGIVVVGLCVLLASQAHDLETVLLAWLLAGAANSVANVSYESVLQERTPDRFRGRVFAAFEMVTNVAFLTGAFLAGWVGTHFGVRLSYVFSGTLFIAAAVVARSMLWNARPGARVLIGFERRARRAGAGTHEEAAAGAAGAAFTAPPPPIPQPRAGHPYPELQSVFSSRDSVFAGGESVFALAEREADGRADDDVRSPISEPAAGLAGPSERQESVEPAYEAPAFVEGSEHSVEEWVVDEVVAPTGPWIGEEAGSPVEEPAAALPQPSGDDDVERLAASFDPADRLRAIEIALQSSGDPLVSAIVKALGDPAAQVRRRAAEELGKLSAREAIPALDHAIEDPDESVRAAALEALTSMQAGDAPLHEDAIISAIVDALRDESPDVRRAAATELLVRGSLQRWLGDVIDVKTVKVSAEDSTLAVVVQYARLVDGRQVTEQIVAPGAAG